MKISVVITTYNHEKYINQCVDSILAQKGDFDMEIILGDDCSTDHTAKILGDYQRQYSDLFVFLPNDRNLGITKNLKRCLDACRGNYIAICEGDDYWISNYKLQKQIQMLEQHPEYSMCFSSIMLYYQEENRLIPFSDQLELTKEALTIDDLLNKNYIGNFSCCMYRTQTVRNLPENLFDIFTVDWMFNMACSEHGKIGHIREHMSVYRKHSGGAWTGKPATQSLAELMSLIDIYNKFFLYKYDKQFMKFRDVVENELLSLRGCKLLKDEENESVANFEIPAPESSVNKNLEPEILDNKINLFAQSDLAYPPARGSKYRVVRAFKDVFRPYWRALIRWRNKGFDYIRYARWSLENYIRSARWDLETRTDDLRKVLQTARINRLRSVGGLKDLFQRRFDLLILDTIFPHPLSPFRYQEFSSYLQMFPNSIVLTTGEHIRMVDKHKNANQIISDFEKKFPEFRGRTRITLPDVFYVKPTLAYITFLYNANLFLPVLEKKHIPFIFTLYPGGSFEINQPNSDLILKRVFSSPEFRKVIVTQKLTRDYLLSKSFCSPDQIEFIYGVVSQIPPVESLGRHKYYGFEKETLDICFVAYKYMEKGTDKGYDVFIATAKKLAMLHENIYFHVVGNFTNTDIPLENLAGKITFYGVHTNNWLAEFYLGKDIILSPNVPFKLLKGQFDGFPTASCTDAAFQGVAVFCTDLLDQNIKFTDREEIVIVPYDVEKIFTIIDYYYANPDLLKSVARHGADKMREIYSAENQITPRVQVLQRELSREETRRM